MTKESQNVQKVDAKKLTCDEMNGVAESSRIDEDKWNFEFKGLGLYMQFGRKIKSWMKLER